LVSDGCDGDEEGEGESRRLSAQEEEEEGLRRRQPHDKQQ
jgi:hypothetical protein